MSSAKKMFSTKLDEPAYFKFVLNDNIVQQVDISSVYLENENMQTLKNLYADSSNNSSFAYAMALEKIKKIEPSRRSNYLRVIADEVLRMSSHLFNLGMLSHMVKASLFMAQAMKTRQLVQELQQIVLKSKFDCAMSVLGGVKHDISTKDIADIKSILVLLRREVVKLTIMFEKDKSIKEATYGIGVISHQNALDFGLTGPVARASGINNDVRVNLAYAIYEELEPAFITRDDGDVYARAMIRCEEIKDSLRMIEQAILQLPEGKIVLKEDSTMSFDSQAFSRVEAPRGELFCYVKTHTSDKENIIKYRTPTYMNWQVLKLIIPNNEVSNVPLIVNSIDPCLSFM